MNFAAISLDIAEAQSAANIAAAIAAIEQLPDDTDVIVLPELFTTGFIPDRETMARLAEPMDGPALTALRSIAHERNCLICASLDIADEGHLFNRGFIINGLDGTEEHYDKRHLFSVSEESRIFSAGRRHMPTVNFKGWKVSMIICYDLRFPVWSRNTDHRYDMLLVPANWPISRGYAWTHLLIARAIENQAVVVGANRSGTDRFGDYDNLSEIFDPLGMPIGHTSDSSQVVLASASLDDITTARRRLPVHLDADQFDINL